MIEEYLKQLLVTDYKDPTYTVVISSLDINEECDHEKITVGLKQYNPSIYDLFKEFYKEIRTQYDDTLSLETEQDLYNLNQEAKTVADQFLSENSNYATVNDRKLVLRSGLEYDNDRKIYRSILNANIVDGIPTSESRIKTVITSNDSDIFVFNLQDDVYLPLYLYTDYNEPIRKQILMITLMDHKKNNIFDNKIILITDTNGHALYYPSLPTITDQKEYTSGTNNDFYYSHSYFVEDGIPRYKYFIKVDYPGTEEYEAFSKLFTIFIAKGSKTNTGGS